MPYLSFLYAILLSLRHFSSSHRLTKAIRQVCVLWYILLIWGHRYVHYIYVLDLLSYQCKTFHLHNAGYKHIACYNCSHKNVTTHCINDCHCVENSCFSHTYSISSTDLFCCCNALRISRHRSTGQLSSSVPK